MNVQQLLMQMQKQHIEVSNNLDTLEDLKQPYNYHRENNEDKFKKLLNKTEKTLKTLSMTYNLVSRQKLNYPPEMVDIGVEINSFKERLEVLKKD